MTIPKSNRIEYLDSVRGIAATLVVIYHVISSHWDWMPEAKASKIIFNGTGAVAMFFVLSGLVLSLKLFGKNIEITTKFMNQFVVKRILRLYPAFLFTMIFYIYFGYAKTTLPDIFKEVLLIRGVNTLLIPDWTLGVEMALSIFVPFLVLLVRKSFSLFLWFIIMSLLVSSNFISEFLILFGLGILLAYRFKTIQNYDCKQHRILKYKNYLLPFLIILFSFRHITALYPLPSALNFFLFDIISLSSYTFSGCASFLILAFIINSTRMQRMLSNKILVFIGKISYGVYLSHWFFTNMILSKHDYILSQFAGNSSAKFFSIYLILTLLFSFIAGWFIYLFVELPFIKFSRTIFSKKNN